MQRSNTVSKKKEQPKESDQSFEAAFAELEQIVRALESGALALDESLALFERGQQLAACCGVQLDQAELKIQQLTVAPDGVARLAPLHLDEAE
jgi:exodeoxyribonuclease VII small subunit